MAEFGTRVRTITMKNSSANRSLVMNDGMHNVLSGLNTGRDMNSYARWSYNPLSQDQLDNAYRTSWVSKKIHNIIPLDMVRSWRGFKADDEQITAIETEEKRLGLRLKVKQAMTWARLYGGSAIFLGTGDIDLAQPLNVDTVKKQGLKYIHVLTRFELSVSDLDRDPGSEFYGQPTAYQINGATRQQNIHPSRIVRFIGEELPDTLRYAAQGWGDPLLQSLHSAIVHADTVQGTFAALVNKAKVDTLSIPGLTSLISTTEGENQLRTRAVNAAAFESLFNVKLIDAAARPGDPSEVWEQFTMPWAGVPELMTAFLQMVAGAADIPMTRLMGMSPGGMNATGDSDTENYFQMISARQELDLRPRLDMIDEVLIRSALGARPEEIYSTFNPLYVEKEEIKVKNAKARAEASQIYVTAGLVPDAVMAEGVKGQLIESGEYPGIESAYSEYESGLLVDPVEEDDDVEQAGLEGDPDASASQGSNVVQLRRRAVDRLTKMLDADTITRAAYDAAITDATPRSLYVSRKVLNVAEIKAWAKEQGLPELNDDLHVTVLYSTRSVDWLTMGSTWADRDGDGTGKLRVSAGGPRVVEPLGDQGAVLMFASSDLGWRHEEMVRLGASHDYEDYIPHISLVKGEVDLSAVKPYRGKIDLDMEVFEEI